MMGECGVKICGTTTLHDARLAAECGADYFGVVIEVGFSPRSLTVEQALPLFVDAPVTGVALVYQMPLERLHQLITTLHPPVVQFLHLEELDVIGVLKKQYPDLELWQSIHLPEVGKEVDFAGFQATVQAYADAGIDLLIFDTVAVLQGVTKFGGTGMVSDWQVVRKLIDQTATQVPIWLAGGIDPDNVAEAVKAVQPAGVDLCSGVESEPGRKDPDKVRLLIQQAKNA